MEGALSITPIEQYVTYRRDDGQLLDPWMRVHERLGARVGAPLPESLRITGTVGEWESWTGLSFPASGDYVFPEGLAPVTSTGRGSRVLLGAERLERVLLHGCP